MSGENLDGHAISVALEKMVGPGMASRYDIRVVSETGSTNDDVMELARNGAAEGTVVFAESQNAGRGRRGDAWISPPGVNLLFSILVRPDVPVGRWSRLPHLAGLAVCRAIEQNFPEMNRPQLKWPNDVYLSDCKVAGILVESRAWHDRPAAAVVGIGLNVNLLPEQFPDDLRPLATTLREHAGHVIDRCKLAAAVLAEWMVLFPAEVRGDFSSVREELESRSWLMDKQITVFTGDREISGTVKEPGPEGELRVETASGTRETILSADRVIF